MITTIPVSDGFYLGWCRGCGNLTAFSADGPDHAGELADMMREGLIIGHVEAREVPTLRLRSCECERPILVTRKELS